MTKSARNLTGSTRAPAALPSQEQIAVALFVGDMGSIPRSAQAPKALDHGERGIGHEQQSLALPPHRLQC